ncbi:MAG TPA: putative toxin-antitoxin system toxin component, PIN family [Burkholderiales bacterium]|nr:putative toxin-antitoxin system toxin component, PIN family [Burkholderiales bacterium]
MSASESGNKADGTLHLPQRTSAPLRLVLDTNVWLDWLVFDDPDVAPVKSAVAAGRAEVVVDRAVVAELERVLAYPFGPRTLSTAAQSKCMVECGRVAARYAGAEARVGPTRLPVCGDPDDQKFLDLAAACGARYLVTRDRDLLELVRNRDPAPPFRIVTPRELRALLTEA